MVRNMFFAYVQKQIQVQFDIGHFHQRAFFALSGCTGLAAWAWVAFQYGQGHLKAEPVILLISGIFGFAWLVYQGYQRNYLRGTYIFLVGQCLYIASMQWFLQEPNIAILFILVIVMGGALIGPVGVLTSACLAIGIQIGLAMLMPPVLGASFGLPGFVILVGLTALVSWLSTFGIFEALEAVEISAKNAQAHATEARQHRAELTRALKSLDLVNYQLETVNYELFQSRKIIETALQFKRKFAAQISHELLTSLNLIFGFSETIAFAQHTYGTPLPKAYLRDVTEIHRNSRHLLALIDDILDLSKLEVGHLGLHCEPIDIGPVLREAINIVTPLITSKGLSLEANLDSNFPNLMLDSDRIRQVLLNLLSNSARVTTLGGVVVVAKVQAGEVLVQVRDTGPGIPAEELQSIFEEFQQSDALAGAAGLGLAVSKQIVNLHGGRMWVQSELGQGSTFSLAFPIAESQFSQAVSSKATNTLDQTKPSFVVLGEQESDEMKLLQRHLEGVSLKPASTLDEARTLVTNMGARAIVTTLDIIPNPHQVSLPVPLVICDLPGPRKAAQTMGIKDYIRKPVTLNKLQTTLTRVAPTAQSLLIVDDEPAAVRLMKRLIQATDKPYQLAHAYSGQAAWDKIQSHKPDLLLLDLAMNDGDGHWLIQKLDQSPDMADIPIIAVSGQITRETYESGPISIYHKNFTPSETLTYLQALLATIPPAGVSDDTIVQPLTTAHPV